MINLNTRILKVNKKLRWKFLDSLDDSEEESSLSGVKQVIVGTFQQLQSDDIFHLYMYMFDFPPGIFFLFYIFETYILALPLHVVIYFLAWYSRKKIIEFWDCSPVFRGKQGISFSLLLFRIILFVRDNYFTGLLFYINFFTYERNGTKTSFFLLRPIWSNCDFPDASSACLSMEENYTSCDPNKTYELSLIQFVRLYVKQRVSESYSFKVGEININLLLINLGFLVLTGIVILAGKRRFMKIYFILLTIALASLTFVFSIMFFNLPKSEDSVFEYYRYFHKAQNYFYPDNSLWIVLGIIDAICIEETVTTAWIGTSNEKNINPTVLMGGVFTLKIVGIFIWSGVLKMILTIFIIKYKEIIVNCKIKIKAQHIFLEILMEILLDDFKHTHAPGKFYINFHCLYSFINNAMAAIIITESLAKKKMGSFKHRIIISIVFVSCTFCMSFLMILPYEKTLTFIWEKSASFIRSLLYLVICFALYYVYSMKVINADYVFTYQRTMLKCNKWMFSVSTTLSLVVFICACFTNIQHFQEVSKASIYIKLMIPVVIIILLSPIVIVFIYHLALYFSDFVYRPVQPKTTWGPIDKRKQRSTCVPERDICYRHPSVTCTHKCLIKNVPFKQEQITQLLKLRYVINKLGLKDIDVREISGIDLAIKSRPST